MKTLKDANFYNVYICVVAHCYEAMRRSDCNLPLNLNFVSSFSSKTLLSSTSYWHKNASRDSVHMRRNTFHEMCVLLVHFKEMFAFYVNSAYSAKIVFNSLNP